MLPDLASFSHLNLPGGFLLAEIRIGSASMIDPAGRPALARTTINGRNIEIILLAGMSVEEQSISIYHETLEGLTVGTDQPPESVCDFLESDFEKAAIRAHQQFGFATPENVISFLKGFHFL